MMYTLTNLYSDEQVKEKFFSVRAGRDGSHQHGKILMH